MLQIIFEDLETVTNLPNVKVYKSTIHLTIGTHIGTSECKKKKKSSQLKR